MRLLWPIAIGLVLLITTSESEGKTCFFSISRPSPFEKGERKGGMKVSSGDKCSGNLVGLDKLKTVKPKKEYYGTFHDLDLSLTRGAGHYMKDANDMSGIPADIHICEAHLMELATHWHSRTYPHIHFETKKGTHIMSCSWPEYTHSKQIQRSGQAHYLTREETEKYLMITGIHLHRYAKSITINAGKEKEEEQCDPSYTEKDDSEDGEDKEDCATISAMQEAFFVFAKEAGIDRTCPKKSFMDYTKDTQTRKVRTAEKLLWAIADILAPGWQGELIKRMKLNGDNDWSQLIDEKMGGIIREIRRHYLMADDSRTRYIILSQAAGALIYSEILPYFPGLSPYKYTKARKIAKSLELPPQITIVRERLSDEMIEEFVFYIARQAPHNYVTLPTGTRSATLSNGEIIDIPDVIRILGQTELIRQYKKYMAEQGKSHLVPSESTMIRILNALPATKRHSMTCVDTYKAASYKSFEDMSKMLDELNKELGLISSEEATSKRFDWLEIRHYLKTDYPLHVKPDSRVADHSMLFALSDPDNKDFYVKPTHEHDLQCPRCNHIVATFRAMEELLTTLSLNSQANARKISEMIFRLTGHKETIIELKKHELRSVYTNLERERLIENLEEGEALMTGDYGQKVVPCKHYEDQISYFGKRGMSWHFFHVLAKVERVYVQHAFIHVMYNDNAQTSQSVTSTVDMALRGLSIMGIHSVHIRTDNAAYYHCAGTIGSMISISEETGVKVKSWSFSEPQDGKGPADRCTGITKSKLRRQINSGKDMENQDQLIDLLEAAPLLKGVSFYLFNIYDSPTPQTPSKIPRITDYSHFEFGEDSIRAWKYRGIGEGVVFKKDLHSNVLPYEIVRSGGYLPNHDDAMWDSWRIKNGNKAVFWHYDPVKTKNAEVRETEEDEDIVDEEDPKGTPGKKGLLFACPCGASYTRHGDLLNHLNFGKHERHPWKMTSIDRSRKFYKKCLEDTIQVKSLIPLQDCIENVLDASIPPLSMGWALRGAKKNAPLPEKAKKLIQAFFLETKKINKRADPEEAFRRMVADPSISFEERMTIEQVKSYIRRLVAVPKKKKAVVRGKRSTDMEVDEDGDPIEWEIEERDDVGEWEAEEGCENEEEGQMDDADVYSDFIRNNKAALYIDEF